MSNSKKHLDEVKASFDSMDDYDAMVVRAIPEYERMLDALLMLTERLAKPKKILELGVGTGLVAQALLRAFPKAHLTAVDFAPSMIEKAAKRLSRMKNRIDLVEGDFYEVAFPCPTDLVVSSLAIHHLDDVQKAQLYEKIYDCLADDGVFINADCVMATSDRMERAMGECWIAQMGRLGIGSEQVDKTIADHEHYDIPATVDDQLGWLDRAGFAEVECVWRSFDFAIIVAIK